VIACSDGYARLYDVRHPLLALTLDVGNLSEACSAFDLAYPNGVPSADIYLLPFKLTKTQLYTAIFTSSESREQIKLWDVRARTVKYELSTGNNSVENLAWDPTRNTLYATTECKYIDRMGNHHGYRNAKVPKVPNITARITSAICLMLQIVESVSPPSSYLLSREAGHRSRRL
jgi:hypothetical protein